MLQMDKKDKTNDLLDCLKVGGDLPKEKGQEQSEKKIISVSNEDGDVALHDKGNIGGDGDEKRKKESIEENRLYNEKAQIEGKELGPVEEPDCQPRSRKEKNRKHGNNNAPKSREISKDENMVSDDVVHGKEQGPANERDCDPKSGKEKRRKHKVHGKKLGSENVSMLHEISMDENVVSDEVVHRKEQGPADVLDCGPELRKEKKRKREVREKNVEINNVPMAHETSKGENVASDEQDAADELDCGPKSRQEKKRKKHEVNEKNLGNDNAPTSNEISNEVFDVVAYGKEHGAVDEPPKSRKEKKHEINEKEHENNNVPTSDEISNEVFDVVAHGKEHREVDEPAKSRKEKKHEINEKEHENKNGPTSHEISKGENMVSDEVFDVVSHGKEHGAVDEPPKSRKEKKHDINEKEHENNNVPTLDEISNEVFDVVAHGMEHRAVDEPPKSRKEKKHEINEKEHEKKNGPTSHEISTGENMVSDEVGYGKEHGAIDDPHCNPESRKETNREHEVHEKKLGNTNAPTSHEISKGEIMVSEEVVHSKSSLDEDTSKMINDIVDAVKKNTERGAKESNALEMKKNGNAKAIETSMDYSMTESFEKADEKTTAKMKKTDEVCNLDLESGKGCSTSQGQELVAGESDIKTTFKTLDSEDKEKKSIEESKVKGKSKKVSFSGQVEIFPSSDTDHKMPKQQQEDQLVRGKRFTPEEDELVKEAVLNYIKANNLGEEGLTKILRCHAYPEIRNCWKEIGTCIPYRPVSTIYYRAHNLFERAEKRGWTEEETEFLQKSYKKHGNNWKMVAKELGKHRVHVKDKWRRIKQSNKKGGKWSQEEYQNLHDLVNLDLQMKVVSKEKKSKHGMLRDNIPWGAISDKLSTRSDFMCCQKWYSQLTSSLVAEDKWSNADDYRLISALYDLDAACVEDVDWDALLDHRPGDVCRKRWDQMVLHIGHHGSQPFSEQVETLSKRYCPDLAEIREAWDSKPLVQ